MGIPTEGTRAGTVTIPAAISAQLVDMRNVGTHKSLKLTLHVPEEYALKAIEAFGWPTGAHPVPVALARLTEEKPKAPGKVATEKRLVQQAGILCADRMFQKFLDQTHHDEVLDLLTDAPLSEEEIASEFVRDYCGVKSRSEIILGSPAAEKWNTLAAEFEMWKRD